MSTENTVNSQEELQAFEQIAREVAALNPTMQEIKSISQGWLDTLVFDRKFILPKLKQRSSQAVDTATHLQEQPTIMGEFSAQDLLEQLDTSEDAAAVERSVDTLVVSNEAAVIRDDYFAVSDDALCEQVCTGFNSDRFNLVIIGAGPVGALLASALKRELGDCIDILLIESRISSAHHKQPYNRRWQVNIPLQLMQTFVHPKAAAVCAQTGAEGFIGVDMCALETLALLSARAAGVRCLFSTVDVNEILEGAPVHLIADTSGGRWRKPIASAEKIYPNMRLQSSKARTGVYAAFGLKHAQEIPNDCIDVLHKDGVLYPLHAGKPLKQSMLKLMHVPIGLYPKLLAWAEKNNRDNKFYFWPGRKHADINKLLVLVNLTVKEHQMFSKYIQAECDLDELSGFPALRDVAEPRLLNLLRIIKEPKDSIHKIRVSAPFIVSPRMLDPDTPIPDQVGIPVLPIGDSFFTGNPKTGNGLGVHLRQLHLVGHHLVKALRSTGEQKQAA